MKSSAWSPGVRIFILTLGLLGALCAVPKHTMPLSDAESLRQQQTELLPSKGRDHTTKTRVQVSYGNLPLHFEANQGQSASQVKFLSRGRGSTFFLTSTEAVFVLQKLSPPMAQQERPTTKKVATNQGTKVLEPSVLHMRLVGANPEPQVVGLEELPGKINYFTGNESQKWHTNIPTYSKVRYRNVYPGIDLVYYGNQQQLEYDFIVSPGADPQVIRLAFEGADDVRIDNQGDLVLQKARSQIRQRKPILHQELDGSKKIISGGYVLSDDGQIGFQVAEYDRNLPLVIDPVLVYSTYVGGGGLSGEEATGVAIDSNGNAYVTGTAFSVDFPTSVGAFATSINGVGTADSFVIKLDPAGTSLLYATYLGGSGNDYGWGIAVDANGNVYVTGTTASPDFPTTPGAFNTYSGDFDAFVVQLNSSGSALVYSIYLGGSQGDQGRSIALDADLNAYVTGFTNSEDFPTANALQSSLAGQLQENDAFVAKINPLGTTLIYSTYLGGSSHEEGQNIAVDTSGNAYVLGVTQSSDFPTVNPLQPTNPGLQSVFITKLNSTGSAMFYSTYFGGSGHEEIGGIAVDADGNVVVTGTTNSVGDFPLVNAIQPTFGGPTEIFVAKLNTTGQGLVYSTYWGGSDEDSGEGIAVDTSGNAYVTGYTRSGDFPTVNPIQASFGGIFDLCVMKLTPTGAVLFSTYLGGSDVDFTENGGNSIAVDTSGNVYVVGTTASSDFPTTPNVFSSSLMGSSDAFVVKLHSAENTPGGSNVVVQPQDTSTGATPVTLTFSNVTQPGTTSLTTSSDGPTPPAGFSLGEPPTSYEIATTAVFSGSVDICINYTGVSYTDELQLKLFHFEGSVWVDRTVTLDTVTNVICASVISLSPFAILQPAAQALHVAIDIKPGSFPNSINLGSGGTVPVAIFSTPTFDARTVNPLTVTLASAPVKLKGKGTPMASFEDVDGNGLLDLVVHVSTEALQLSETDTAAVLEGQAANGTRITGTDSVRIVP